MTIQTNLSVSPYFDQHDVDSDYYRILFKPSTAVQTRELNELQTILQSQIEKFGDVILKTGTLLDGCQASFNTALPFVKIKDTVASVQMILDGKGDKIPEAAFLYVGTFQDAVKKAETL
jgi:hypothetical protein